MINYFFKYDNKNNIRIIKLELIEHLDNNIEYYTIEGKTGIYLGNLTNRPIIKIIKGKVKRSIKEQAILEYNSICNKFKDKGYKSQQDLEINDITNQNEVISKVPKNNTDTNGNKKPMLALDYKTINESLLNNKWIGSKKIDGVRCLLFKKDGIIQTSSRGGKHYNIAAYYIINDPFVKYIFDMHPDYILDGELYIHGKPLSYISGLCRLETLNDKHKELTFQCYDIVDESLIFTDRLKILDNLSKIIFPNSKLEIVDQTEVQGKENIINLHDYYVKQGYEGLVIRDPNQVYKCGARDKRMLKIKMFQDSEFKIVGITEGLRPEDFVFNMETKEGYSFEAKPIGDINLKKWYRDNLQNIIGKYGTVKFFGYTHTDKPVPNLPVFKNVRLIEDI